MSIKNPGRFQGPSSGFVLTEDPNHLMAHDQKSEPMRGTCVGGILSLLSLASSFVCLSPALS
jgi:hypothetical protein